MKTSEAFDLGILIIVAMCFAAAVVIIAELFG